MENLGGLFTGMNEQVGELTLVMTYEHIQMLADHNSPHNFDNWIFFKWISRPSLPCFVLFKTGSLSKSIWGAH